ncbi:D-glycero-beta-D-manno-heptose 1-phosphate adenylyltransferase [bacterium]|nr:D-glycero-beta-D-manno-heptose 1-phosphate adenylyltransferase [bacterium]
MGTILSIEQFKPIRKRIEEEGKKLVFTNGCFDILHTGHIRLLKWAKTTGDKLLVGLNSDSSTRRLKGDGHPILPQDERAEILSSLACVDYVIIFDEDTPQNLINEIIPDILVKGGDYRPEEVVGRETVENAGGKLLIFPLVKNHSTTKIIQTVIERFCDGK